MPTIPCPGCGKNHFADATHAGRQFHCHTCSRLITIPETREGGRARANSGVSSQPERKLEDLFLQRRRVRWRGAEFVLWGTATDAGIMADDAAIDAGELPYAWLGPSGDIYRHGRAVGSAAEIEFLEDWR
jgi:ribosomal protein S27E